MGGLFGGSRTQVTNYSGIQIQDTIATAAIPIVFGMNMLTPNVIDYRGFNSKKENAKSGGKGGAISNLFGSIFGTVQETVYFCDLIMGICEGPIDDIFSVYQTSFTPLTLAETNLNLVVGDVGQAPTSSWESKYPGVALGYSGIAYLWSINFDLGPSASVGSTSVVVQSLRYGTGFNGVDADPALVIQDILTSPQFGVEFPSGQIANLTGVSGDGSLQAYCHAVGLAFSPVLNDREDASAILDRWLSLLNCTCVWSSGVLKFAPRGDQTVTGNGWTFTPDLTVRYALDDDSYCVAKGKGGVDPVQVIRSDPYSADNVISIEFVDRLNNFNSGSIPVFDQTAIDRFGVRIGASISAREITHPTVAQLSAQLSLQRGLYVRRTFAWRLSWEYCRLDPMDIVSLTDTRIGLEATLVRITEIEEDDSGLLSFTAEEFIPGVATAAAYGYQTPTNGTPNGTVAPAYVNTPLLFEPPPALTNDTVQVWGAVSPVGADPDWGGCVVNASFDGETYAPVETLNGPSNMGAMTSSLASYSGSNPDNTNTLSVNMSEGGGGLQSTTTANAEQGVTALWVGGEIIGYTTATLTGPGTYNLTGLYRGLYGTRIASHASGTQIALLSGLLVKYTLPTDTVSSTLHLKFPSFNIFNTQLQSLSACTDYTYTITGDGLVDDNATPYTATWTAAGGSSNPAIGDGTLAASFSATGNTDTVSITLTIGTTTTFGVGGSYAFSAPANSGQTTSGTFLLVDSSGTQMGSGSSSITSGSAQIQLYDTVKGLVGPATYMLNPGDVMTISLTYQT